jgi:hypothetical protein
MKGGHVYLGKERRSCVTFFFVCLVFFSLPLPSATHYQCPSNLLNYSIFIFVIHTLQSVMVKDASKDGEKVVVDTKQVFGDSSSILISD